MNFALISSSHRINSTCAACPLEDTYLLMIQENLVLKVNVDSFGVYYSSVIQVQSVITTVLEIGSCAAVRQIARKM